MRYSEMFPQMADVVPAGTVGVAEVSHFTVSESSSRMTLLSRRPGINFVPAGRYARLCVRGQTVMSDTRMERNSNYAAVREATGRVLVAGLGLGMVLVPMLKKPDVTEVTVVEREMDVVRLVAPAIRKHVGKDAAIKLVVVVEDINSYRPAGKFGAAYFDIWPDINTENLPEIARLHQRFKGALDRSGGRKPWMGSWMADYLRDERREAQRGGYW